MERQLRQQLKAGFEKAMSAIIDGNITTIIAGIVLLLMGTGTVKGFARTLILGIILSMFTALVITRILLNSFVNLELLIRSFMELQRSQRLQNIQRASNMQVHSLQ